MQTFVLSTGLTAPSLCSSSATGPSLSDGTGKEGAEKWGALSTGVPGTKPFLFTSALCKSHSLSPPFVFLHWYQQSVDGNYKELGPRVGAVACDMEGLLTSFSKRRWLSQTVPFLQLRRGPFQVRHGALCPPRCLSGYNCRPNTTELAGLKVKYIHEPKLLAPAMNPVCSFMTPTSLN